MKRNWDTIREVLVRLEETTPEEGHEFLDAIRSDTVWQKTKSSFVSKGLSMTFDLVKSVALDIASTCLRSTMSR